MRHHGHTIGHGELDHVGQVELALGVLVVQPGQPRFEQFGRHGHDAAVHLFDGVLRGRGVFVFDDGLHAPGSRAHDAAIARGVGKVDRQQGEIGAIAGRNQVTQSVSLGQRHIARQNNHHAVIGQHGHSLLHGVAGAELRLLAHKLQVKAA